MSFMLCTPALAANNKTQVIDAGDGTYFVIQKNPVVVAYYDKEGHIQNKCWVDTTSNEITTQIYDLDHGVPKETVVLNMDELVIASSDKCGVSGSSNIQISPLYVYDDEPLLNNSGMPASTIFPGWYIIGTYTNTIYPDYKATVVRKFSGGYYYQGEAHKLRITEGTVASAIVTALMTLGFSGGNIPASAAAAIADFISNTVKDSLDVTVTYRSFHYLYQVGINSNRVPQHKYCRAIDFWYCEGGGKSTYEYRGATVGHFNGTNHSDQALSAISAYTMGWAPSGSFCGIQ